MFDHERQFETQNPTDRLGTAMLQLGIKPELVAELDPYEARVVVGAVTKALSTLVHPDRGRRDQILDLGIGDINYLSSLIGNSEDSALGEAIDHIAEISAGVSTKKQNELLGKELDRVAEVNHQLAEAVIRSHEMVTENMSMSFLMFEPPIEATTSMGEHAVSVQVRDGIITEALAVQARGSLLTAFPEHIQTRLTELRPDLKGDEVFVHLDTVFPDDETMRGWAKLVTATSRKDPAVKKPAIKLYGADDQSYELTDLVGARVIGSFSYNSDTPEGFTLSIDSRYHGDLPESTGIGSSIKTYYRIRNEELAHLFGRNHARILGTVQDIEMAQRLVFHHSAGQGKEGTNFITTDIAARVIH